MPVVFDNDDNAYQDWIQQHQKGYVANTKRSPGSSYYLIHRASCRTISSYDDTHRAGGYTERDYVKIASINLKDLEQWGIQNRNLGNTRPMRCQICSP